MNELRESIQISTEGWASCDFCLEKGLCVERAVSFRLLICEACVAKASALFAEQVAPIPSPAQVAFLKKMERREAWRAIHCPPECSGNWSQCCPGCHDPIPDDFQGGSK